jgi:hypothetical protein
MPVFNAASTLPYAIRSIQQQTFQDFELLIVDDASDDDSVQVAKEIAGQDSRIKVIESEKNRGAYHARNLGLSIARGDYVTVNDADDWSFPERLEVQLNAIVSHPGVVASYSDELRVSRDLRVITDRPTPRATSLLFSRVEILKKAGFCDIERVSSDSEFLERIQALFGKSRVLHIRQYPLTLSLQAEHSLTTASELGLRQALAPGGFRSEYFIGFRNLHSDPSQMGQVFPLDRYASLNLMENYGVSKKAESSQNCGLLFDVTDENIELDTLLSYIPVEGKLEIAHNQCGFGFASKVSGAVRKCVAHPQVMLSTPERVEGLKVVQRFPCSGIKRGYSQEVINLCPCAKFQGEMSLESE